MPNILDDNLSLKDRVTCRLTKIGIADNKRLELWSKVRQKVVAAAPSVYQVYPGRDRKEQERSLFAGRRNNRGSTVQGLGCKEGVGTAAVQQCEIEIAAEVKISIRV